MANQIVELISFLSNPALPIPDANKNNIKHLASALSGAALTPDNLILVENSLKAGLKTKDQFKALLICSLLLSLTQKSEYGKLLSKKIRAYKPDLQTANSIYTTLLWLSFSEPETAKQPNSYCGRDTIMSLIQYQLRHMQRIYTQTIEKPRTSFKRTNRVVVITRQMQMPPHAPSVRTFEFAHNLITKYGKEVLVVCSSESSVTNTSPIIPYSVGNTDPRFFKITQLAYEGLNIPFHMCDEGVFSESGVAAAVKTIHDFEPEMILSIGSPNILGELFYQCCFCFFYMSGRDLPLTKHQYFHTWEEPNSEQQKILQAEGLDKKLLFVSTPGYHVRPQFETLTRAQFNIPEDAYVFAVIGMRLDTEVTPDFLALMEKIASSTNSYFIFAGNFDEFDNLVSPYSDTLRERCRFIGMQMDIMAVYALVNAYLNPERTGGGSSAAQALHAGLPVLTTTKGDVGFMAQNFPDLADYGAMAQVAIQLTTDAKTQKAYAGYAKAECERISVREEYLEKVMAAFEDYADKHTA